MNFNPTATGLVPASPPRAAEGCFLDLAIAHLTFEGLQIFGGGVCAVTQGHLESLPSLQQALAAEGIRLTPYFAEIAYQPGHPRWVDGMLKKSMDQVEALGGSVHLLPNYTTGLEPNGAWGVRELGGIENWKVLSAAATGFLLDVGRRHQRTFAYLHDTPYALASIYTSLQAPVAGVDVTTAYVAHASAIAHELPLPNPERLMVESAAIHWAKFAPGCFAGAISDYMSHQLTGTYGARPQDVLPVRNGIAPTSAWYRQRDQSEIAGVLAGMGIPTDRPLVVSFGRAAGFKRHDLTVRAAGQLNGAAHLVLVIDEDRPDLRELAPEVCPDSTLITSFDRELVACLTQWQQTAAVVLLSEGEPCGIMPMEARLLARATGGVLILSDSGGFREQASDGDDTLVCEAGSPLSAAAALRRAMELGPADRERMRTRSATRVLRDQTWQGQTIRTLSAVYPEVALVADAVMARLQKMFAAKIDLGPSMASVLSAGA